MKNLEVARAFLEIAGLLEVLGGDPFRIRAYRRAARSVETHQGDLEEMASQGRLQEIPGVGKALSSKIQEVLESGTCRYLEELREKVPVEVLQMMRIPGVGAKTAALIYREMGIVGLDELETAARARKLRDIPGLGEKKEEAIIKGIEALRRHGERVLLGIALPVAEAMAGYLRSLPQAVDARVAGSLRRMKESVKDIDLVVSSWDPLALMEGFVSMPGVKGVIRKGKTESTVATSVGNVDLRVVEPGQFPAALHHFTGSKEHNARLRGIARKAGLGINEYGVFREDGEALGIWTEGGIYHALGMAYVPPELREDLGEVEAALDGHLPQLVGLEDIKGDLHIHSTWSDGVATIGEMAEAARARGYQYLAISDHTSSLKIAGGLDEEGLREQAREIDGINEHMDSFRVLRGTEVDILASGRLDLSDAVLEDLDIVVASIHQGFSQPREVLTERLEGALKNPHVDIIGHPTGRLIGRREPYPVDLERVLDLASRTGTALEINACPDRLDLKDEHARKAASQGVRIAINTDAHDASALPDMRYGVGVARRAWLKPADILNTLDLEDLLDYLG
ncbi:MAG: DNA polymerase/3'-5' exonuclease PolX [Bacillota bacterium]